MRIVTWDSLRRWLRWAWRWRIVRPLTMPLCDVCRNRRAEVWWWGRWWCRRHPLMVPAAALGKRPRLLVPTKRGSQRRWQRMLAGVDGSPAASGFWRGTVEADPGPVEAQVLSAYRTLADQAQIGPAESSDHDPLDGLR